MAITVDDVASHIDNLLSGNGFGSDFTPDELRAWAEQFLSLIRQAEADGLRAAAKFRDDHDLDHAFWSKLAEVKYTPGNNMVSVWLRDRANRIERGESPR